mmetsp:Transcript_7277/g.27246  ORF Transcript_7277/g.27246 Transcript_7277/m.27246 type:complete len:135 (+) Transcript_7277:250-654(+)
MPSTAAVVVHRACPSTLMQSRKFCVTILLSLHTWVCCTQKMRRILHQCPFGLYIKMAIAMKATRMVAAKLIWSEDAPFWPRFQHTPSVGSQRHTTCEMHSSSVPKNEQLLKEIAVLDSNCSSSSSVVIVVDACT